MSRLREMDWPTRGDFEAAAKAYFDRQVAKGSERLDAFERRAIVEAIRATGGEIAAAIGLLQIPRKTLYRAKRLGIDLNAERASAGRAL